MSNTDIILITIFATCMLSVSGFMIIKKINQFTQTPENLLTRRGEIELGNLNEPTPVYYPRGQESFLENKLIRYEPVDRSELITIIDGLNSDPISLNCSNLSDSIPFIVSINSSNLQHTDDSLNLQPTDGLYVYSILEDEYNLYLYFIILIIIIIILFTFNIKNKPANTFFNKN